ncbi:hypothetical protein AHMF7616_01485 [Adhaeribacter pallidiroseus]|uniref:Uncharacterized protein n=1 Tax=Adhaeribacter pallidiroseus TaxID=2072847 RepID=A0A369QI28_9BACT|nr:hypothetical protein AHMF7616_01485 [Adhaeribacter pallidiroseus]
MASPTSGGALEPQPAGWPAIAPRRQLLRQIAKWAKLLAIMGFILVAYWVIKAFTFNTFLDDFLIRRSLYELKGPIGIDYTTTGLILRITGPLFKATLYFLPSWYLYRFSSTLKHVLVNEEHAGLEVTFFKLNSFFKTCVTIALALIGYYGLYLFFFILSHILNL